MTAKKKVVPDDVLGRFARQQSDLFRRVREGGLDVETVMRDIQAIIQHEPPCPHFWLDFPVPDRPPRATGSYVEGLVNLQDAHVVMDTVLPCGRVPVVIITLSDILSRVSRLPIKLTYQWARLFLLSLGVPLAEIHATFLATHASRLLPNWLKEHEVYFLSTEIKNDIRWVPVLAHFKAGFGCYKQRWDMELSLHFGERNNRIPSFAYMPRGITMCA